MTEQEWLERQDFFLNSFEPPHHHRLSHRQCLLAACHVLSRPISILGEEGQNKTIAQKAINLATLFADEKVSGDELIQTFTSSFHDTLEQGFDLGQALDDLEPWELRMVTPTIWGMVTIGIYQISRVIQGNSDWSWRVFTSARQAMVAEVKKEEVPKIRQAEKAWQTNLIREIMGNPFRPVTIEPSWRSEPAMTLTQAMYDDQQFAAMPILADALEEAGCINEAVLGHCRVPSEHVRGCWLLDLLLGKK